MTNVCISGNLPYVKRTTLNQSTTAQPMEAKGAKARLEVVKQLLAQSQFIRRNCTPEEAAEAVEWEKKLEARQREISAAV